MSITNQMETRSKWSFPSPKLKSKNLKMRCGNLCRKRKLWSWIIIWKVKNLTTRETRAPKPEIMKLWSQLTFQTSTSSKIFKRLLNIIIAKGWPRVPRAQIGLMTTSQASRFSLAKTCLQATRAKCLRTKVTEKSRNSFLSMSRAISIMASRGCARPRLNFSRPRGKAELFAMPKIL